MARLGASLEATNKQLARLQTSKENDILNIYAR